MPDECWDFCSDMRCPSLFRPADCPGLSKCQLASDKLHQTITFYMVDELGTEHLVAWKPANNIPSIIQSRRKQ